MRPFDVAEVRADFPGLAQSVNGKPLVYLDNAATAQKPRVVIDAIVSAYTHDCANIHRAVHTLSQRATARYEAVREHARAFVNAKSTHEIVYVRGTTEALNLVAATHGRENLREGDEILLTALDHHSNIVPWQLLAKATGARIVVAPITNEGEVTVEAFEKALSKRTKIVSFAHVSNALGTVLPVRALADRAHAVGAVVVVDGAQGAVHEAVDVQALGADFYAFSGHKIYGPTGVGVLYGREALLEAMPPYQGGGDMIDQCTFEGTTWNALPYKFEAGTPDIAGVIALGAAIEYMKSFDQEAVRAHEHAILRYATERVSSVPGVRIVGTAPVKSAVISFVMEGAHPSDVGTMLDLEGVAVRTGHHCTQPLMARLGLPATARASFAMYTSREDIDAFANALEKVATFFR